MGKFSSHSMDKVGTPPIDVMTSDNRPPCQFVNAPQCASAEVGICAEAMDTQPRMGHGKTAAGRASGDQVGAGAEGFPIGNGPHPDARPLQATIGALDTLAGLHVTPLRAPDEHGVEGSFANLLLNVEKAFRVTNSRVLGHPVNFSVPVEHGLQVGASTMRGNNKNAVWWSIHPRLWGPGQQRLTKERGNCY